MKTLRVAVAGAGLGGLCLAQGLLRAGADVTVYERDASLAGRRQGYRLHVDARAGLALQACLPPESLAAFQATCGPASRRLTVVSEKLRVLHEQVTGDPDADPYAPDTLSASVDRLTFREVLAAGLDGRIAFGHEVARYEAGADGVRLHFAGGQEAEAEIGETFGVRVRVSPPAPPWPPSRVTVLGDAIHAMSPAGGSGANTALRDAALLSRTLTAGPITPRADVAAPSAGLIAPGAGVAAPAAGLIAAIGDYERQMREYGYAAVAASRQAEAQTGARRSRLLFALYRRRPRLP